MITIFSDFRFNHTTKRFHDVMKSVDVSAFGKVVCCTNILGPRHGTRPYLGPLMEYFEPLVSALETKAGYKRDQNIFAAPYDWRYGGGESRIASEPQYTYVYRLEQKKCPPV